MSEVAAILAILSIPALPFLLILVFKLMSRIQCWRPLHGAGTGKGVEKPD